MGLNDNANTAVWSPMMDGVVVGTEKGRIILFKSKICPLVRSKSSIDRNDDDDDDDNNEEEGSEEEYDEE